MTAVPHLANTLVVGRTVLTRKARVSGRCMDVELHGRPADELTCR